MIIDGSCGEGGGQIIRTSLALACILKTNLKITGIRAKRSNPGLGAQHCVCALAAAQLSGATPVGVSVGSKEMSLMFDTSAAPSSSSPAPPGNKSTAAASPSTYEFDIGSAGSTALVFQTVQPILLFRDCFTASAASVSTTADEGEKEDAGESTSISSSSNNNNKNAIQVTILGGTHNGLSPSLDFLQKTYLPALMSCLPAVDPGNKLSVVKFGFFPAGGGRVLANIVPIRPLSLLKQQQQLMGKDDGGGSGAAAAAARAVTTHRVCDLPASAVKIVKSYDVTFLHTRTAEQGNRSTLGSAAVVQAVAAIQAKFVPPPPNQASSSAADATPSSKTAAAAAAASANTTADTRAIPPPNSICAAEVKHSFGRGWMICQEIVFGADAENNDNKNRTTADAAGASQRTMILSSMEKDLTAMINDSFAQAQQYFSTLNSGSGKLIFADEFLADQLLLPLALFSVLCRARNSPTGFVYSASSLSLHSATNICTIEIFLGNGIFKVRALPSGDIINCHDIYRAEHPESKLPSGPVEIEILAQ